ncbi:MAG TPA: FkbM family methyltransferase [Pyrinomonadaceae bacterium]|nr:FkbM family methyltransferase [Pyrinomonadaceae bacterium]
MNFSALSNNSLIGKILRQPLRLIPRETPLRVLQGPLMGKRWLAGSHTHGCWLGSYEAEIQKRFANEVQAGEVVFDIGANVGFYSLLASVRVGPTGAVYSFEPLPQNTKLLKKHLQINKIQNVTVLEVAVSSFETRSRFDDTSGPASGHFSKKGRLQVQCVSIDFLVSRGRVRPPNCMKIDVEGAEAQALSGAEAVLQAYQPKIFLSTHGPEARRDCTEILRGFGYHLEPLTGANGLAGDEFFASAA